MRFRLPLISVALVVAIAACGKQGPVANGANAVTAVPQAASAGSPTPADGPPTNHANAASPVALHQPAIEIPAALQGRWGLTPADCTAPLAHAKGLLVVNSGELRFYESRAVPRADVHISNSTASGTFHFTGEGQTWDKFESLQRNGDKLTRTETNPAASYTYAKC
jgi:predicted small lipoprotein YifL